MNINDLAKQAGLKVYDTALPHNWVESARLIAEREVPWGFVWGYDKSPMFGEPIPLTDEAKAFAKEIGVKPR